MSQTPPGEHYDRIMMDLSCQIQRGIEMEMEIEELKTQLAQARAQLALSKTAEWNFEKLLSERDELALVAERHRRTIVNLVRFADSKWRNGQGRAVWLSMGEIDE